MAVDAGSPAVIATVAAYIIPAALDLLPPNMDSPAARAMLLAVGSQESRFRHREQVGGPARGFWQFERPGVRGVLEHPATRHHAAAICEALLYAPDADECYRAIRDNDVLACAFARLLLWRHPSPLPGRGDDGEGWGQYLAGWRPGRPHPQTWARFFAEAWG